MILVQREHAARLDSRCRCADVEKRRIPIAVLDAVEDFGHYIAPATLVICVACREYTIEREVN